jgi:hypothetical protein
MRYLILNKNLTNTLQDILLEITTSHARLILSWEKLLASSEEENNFIQSSLFGKFGTSFLKTFGMVDS